MGLGASKTQIWPSEPNLAKNGQNGQNRQKWPKIAQNHPKMTFFDFQSVYTQNDRNFALIPNFSLIFEKQSPKMAKNGQKWPKITKITKK